MVIICENEYENETTSFCPILMHFSLVSVKGDKTVPVDLSLTCNTIGLKVPEQSSRGLERLRISDGGFKGFWRCVAVCW